MRLSREKIIRLSHQITEVLVSSDEVEFGIGWLPWILRGVYPPPGQPPQ